MLNKKLILNSMLVAVILFFMSSTGFSQESLKEKLKQIKGDVDKITVTADGEEFTFEGKDAEKLFKKMKSGTKHHNSFFIKDLGTKDSKKIFIKSDDDSNIIELTDDDFDWVDKDEDGFSWFISDDNDGMTKKIKVEMEDGKKKVSVTTKEDGEEKTKVYEGKEADEYLEKMKAENKDFDIEFKDGKTKKKIIIEKESKDSDDD